MARRLFALTLAALALSPLAAPAMAAQSFEARRVSSSVVYIAIADDKRQIGSGSGFIVAPGIVVTNFHVATGGARLFIVPNGDNGKHAIKAEVILKSGAHDLAVLKAPGLSGRALTLAGGDPAQGVPVWAYGFPGLADEVSVEDTVTASLYTGTVARVLSGKVGTAGAMATRLIQHSALIAPGNSGGPLFDQCHRVVGVNTFLVSKDSSTFLYSVSSSEVITLLRQANVAITPSYAACGDTPAATPQAAPPPASSGENKVDETPPATAPSQGETDEMREKARDDADAAADRARGRAARARAARDAALARNDRTEADRQSSIARKAEEDVAALESYSKALRQQLDDAHDPIERYGPIALALLVLAALIGAIVFTRRRYAKAVRARKQGADLVGLRESEHEARKGSDVILSGPAGSIKLPGVDLGNGVTVGRSAERADVVIPKETVSREHARFTRHAGRLYVYDLDSQNGVYLNGHRIAARQEHEIHSGDRIGFGRDLSFIVESH